MFQAGEESKAINSGVFQTSSTPTFPRDQPTPSNLSNSESLKLTPDGISTKKFTITLVSIFSALTAILIIVAFLIVSQRSKHRRIVRDQERELADFQKPTAPYEPTYEKMAVTLEVPQASGKKKGKARSIHTGDDASTPMSISSPTLHSFDSASTLASSSFTNVRSPPPHSTQTLSFSASQAVRHSASLTPGHTPYDKTTKEGPAPSPLVSSLSTTSQKGGSTSRSPKASQPSPPMPQAPGHSPNHRQNRGRASLSTSLTLSPTVSFASPQSSPAFPLPVVRSTRSSQNIQIQNFSTPLDHSRRSSTASIRTPRLMVIEIPPELPGMAIEMTDAEIEAIENEAQALREEVRGRGLEVMERQGPRFEEPGAGSGSRSPHFRRDIRKSSGLVGKEIKLRE
ncbi:hypothetical protein BJ875DRAFT_495086 [Amylocarpus encephaloides]|uniref:Uncharacterized protein n=1 Tax=Amylocarpus encephaloides TaxID=45428 RepID=A0A9P7YKV0_9HELO|nr:hypothetical protein BJ875DRAFT_495086 [Amylocarpus encephaloides]